MGEKKKNAHVKKVVIVSEELSNVLHVWFDPGRKAPSAESAAAAVTLLLTPKWSHVGFKPVCAIVRRTGEPLIKTETFSNKVQRLLNISAAMPLSRNHDTFTSRWSTVVVSSRLKDVGCSYFLSTKSQCITGQVENITSNHGWEAINADRDRESWWQNAAFTSGRIHDKRASLFYSHIRTARPRRHDSAGL